MTFRALRAEGLDLQTTRLSHKPSISSDMMSTSSRSGAGAVPAASPPPAYIAELAASHLLTTELENAAAVLPSALSLVNGFLDYVLFQLLKTAHGVSLGSLRSAIPKVLNRSLSREALEAGEVELQDYQEEASQEQRNVLGMNNDGAFDLELAWRLARLRCMVYTRLGDMEEEDEEEYLEQDQLRDSLSQLDAHSKGAVTMTPLAAIFVTAVVEYLGEQALYFAAQNAQKRQALSAVPQSPKLDRVEVMHETIVDEADILSLGQGTPLLKLWRSWRMSSRTSRNPLSRSISPETLSPDSPSYARFPGHGPFIAPIEEEQKEAGAGQQLSPSQVPLPVSDDDVREIELSEPPQENSVFSDRQIEPTEQAQHKKRPTSMLIMPGQFPDVPTPTSTHTSDHGSNRPGWARARSNSLPTPSQTPHASPDKLRKERYAGKDGVNDASESRDAPLASTPSLEQIQSAMEPSRIHSQDQTTSDNTERSTHIGSAVAAIANALGGNVAITAPTTENDAATNFAKQPDSAQGMKPTRTVAEQMLGYSTHLSPPKDAHTGSSITSPGDFDNLHIPMQDESRRSQQPTPVQRSRDASDPEDLALSSADEDSRVGQPDHAPNQAVLADTKNVPTSIKSAAPVVAPWKQKSLEALQSATGAPRYVHREAAVYNRIVTDAPKPGTPLKVNVPNDIASDAPKTGESLQAEDFPLPPSARNSQTGPLSTARNSQQGLPTSPRVGIQPVKTSVQASIPEATNDSTTTMTEAETPQHSGSATATSSWPAVVPPRHSSAEAAQMNENTSHARHQSRASEYSQYSDRSSSSSKLLGFNRDLQNQIQYASQQQSMPNSTDAQVNQPQPSNSDPMFVVNSGATKPPRRPPHLRLRSESSENVLGEADADAVKKRSLDLLIKSDETLHYTLTPHSARGEAPEFPAPIKSKSQTQDLADFLRNTSPTTGEFARPNPSRVRDNMNGLRANPISDMEATAVSQPSPRDKKLIPHASQYPQTPTSPARLRNPLGEPRAARAEVSTTRDLADYARSTGPENEEQLPRPLASRPGTAATTRTAPDTSRRHPRTTEPSFGSVDMGRPATMAGKQMNRLKFQARDARPLGNSETSELIDFIRDGPPRTPAEQAKDRFAAPTRSTMHSANTKGPNLGAAARFSDASAATSSVMAPSFTHSENSRTGLLDAAPRSYGPTTNGLSAATGLDRSTQPEMMEDGFPRRTRRKVRDPYAIDESDDEDFEEEVLPQKPKKQEESLIDFLRNTAPPPGMTTQPIMSATAAQRALNNFRQNNANNANSRDTDSDKEVSSAFRPTNGAREESPHLTQTGSKLDKYKPTQTTHATHLERKRQQPRPEPRDAVRSSGTTADLAQYLKNSGPPTTNTSNQGEESRLNTATSKDEAGFLKFFSKRKHSIRN